MDQNDIIKLLKSGVTVSDLSDKLGADFFGAVVEKLYGWWRSTLLLVERQANSAWVEQNDQKEQVIYSNKSFFLPDDFLLLKEQKLAEKLKVATWNVNSIRMRMPLLLSWLKEQDPDIVCLQETKVEDHLFPAQALREAGYSAVFSGQKSYNGVAILSKFPLEDVIYGFKDRYDNDNKRLIMARIQGIDIINVYVPQGESEDSPKFKYKLEFLKKLLAELSDRFTSQGLVMMLGDINIAPDDRDVVSADAMRNVVSFHPKEHAFIEGFKKWGLTDLFRKFQEKGGMFSWWDFRTRGFEKNHGMRIDHIWVTTNLADLCEKCEIDTNNRSQPKPSDHAPVICTVKMTDSKK